MTVFLQLVLAMAILILFAKIGGYISYRLGQPSVLGELLVGILIGPSVINLFHWNYFSAEELSEIIHLLAEVGVVLLMFIAGLELQLTDLVKSGKIAALAGVFGVIVPLAMGAGLGFLFNLDAKNAFFLGLILSATSVSISAQTLMELKVLRSPVGITLLGAAVFDDILVILGLSIFTAVTGSEGGNGLLEVLIILGRMVLFLGLAGVIGWFLIPPFSRWVNKLPISQGLIAFVIVAILLFGWSAEVLGHMAPITGAFLAGVFFARSPLKERIESGVSVLAYALFVPIFFIDVGLSANARLLIGDVFWLFILMVIIAVVSKVIGSGFGALLGKMKKKDALGIGVGMVSRGEVGLIVASVGLVAGLIDDFLFAAVVGVVLVTTLLTPPMLRALYPKKNGETNAQGTPGSDVGLADA